MKKSVMLLMVVVPGMVFSQIKPSVSKAEAAVKAGKLDEAKTIIDATVGSQEFMVDKKGQPSKNAAKAWYLKGVIYASLDTTKNPAFNALEPNAFAVAKEAFDKVKELNVGEKELFYYSDKNGAPIMITVANSYFAQAYFNKAISEYSDKKNYKRAFELTEQTLYFIPEDTMVIMNAGVYFGPAANEDAKSIEYIQKYLDKGGKQIDAYIQLFSLYRDKMKDNEAALKVVKKAEIAYPKNPEFPKYELDLLVKMNRMPEAKAAMEKQVAANPDDKESRYFLGVINMELKDNEEAKKWYNDAIRLDANYFEPRLGLADLMSNEPRTIKKEMNQLGNSAADKKKLFDLDKVYVEKLKSVLPYWQACEKISPDDARVLDELYRIYNDLDMQPELTKLSKHMKTLGLLD